MSDLFSEEIDRGAAGYTDEIAYRWKLILAGEFALGAPLNATSVAAGNSIFVKSGAGMLFGFTASSTLAGAQFVHVFDSASPTVPANGTIPTAVFPVLTTSVLTVSYIFPGRFFYQGCWLANSTTQNSLTIGAANTLFDAQYI